MVPEGKEGVPPPQTGRKRANYSAVCVGVAAVLLCCGGLMLYLWPSVFRHILTATMNLNPGSATYKGWVDPQIPSYMDFHFFNWTNPEDLYDPNKKMKFVEMGPYRFLERVRKVDIVFNDHNHTVTYKQVHHWYFDAENSNGTLSDYITTANPISLGASYIKRNGGHFTTLGLNNLLRIRPMAVTHNVSEMMFVGYEDSLLTLSNSLLGGGSGDFDKYGLFYKKNGSSELDGVFNIGTGTDSFLEAAVVKSWNYGHHTDFYPGACGEIKGTTGERFPVDSRKDQPIVIFSNSMCRSIDLLYEDEDVVEDIPVFRYKGRAEWYDNGTIDPGNECYCGGECVPSGVLNTSSCHEDAPVFTSFPHFYLADPIHLEHLEGLRPDPDKHDFFIAVEPQTGIPIDVAARLQINLLMQPYSKLSATAQLPRVFFPVAWLSQRATITPDLAASFRLLLLIPRLGQIVAVGLLVFGSGMLAIVALWHYRERRIHRKTKARNSICLTPMRNF